MNLKLNRRSVCLYGLLCLATIGILCRVLHLQLINRDFLCAQGDMRTIRVVSTPAYRGIISDRQGEPLAISTPVESVWVEPKVFDQQSTELLTLASILEMPPKALLKKVKNNQNRNFIYLKRQINPQIAQKIRALKIPGVYLKPEYRRYYPAGEVSAHILGLTNLDGHGQEGLELAFESVLKGSEGSQKIIQNRRRQEVKILAGLKPSRSGQNIMLSIDQRLQYLAYRELKAVVAANRAVGGSAVVLDVHTGEVLAMVNQPSFNPNTPIRMTKDGRYRNRALTDTFEPGSVMKTFSVLNALLHGKITPATLIDTSPGQFMVGKHIVREDKNKNFGLIDVAGILRTSSNVGVGKITLSLEPHCLWKTYASLGFGQLTNSGFPGERPGVLVQPSKRDSFSLATMAFGYGLSVTPLQLAQAYAILGADGVKRPVTFLKQKQIPAGKQVIAPPVAKQLVHMLEGIIEAGSGSKAQVVGYRTAGKTGTTRKVASTGGYDKNSHVAVFAGLAPVGQPRFAIVVMIDDPKTATYYGSQLAAPLFSKIAAGALRLFNVVPDAIDFDEPLRMAHLNEKNTLRE